MIVLDRFDYQDRQIPRICYKEAETYLEKNFSFSIDTSATKASLETNLTKYLKIVDKLLNNALSKIEIVEPYGFLKVKLRFSI